MNNKLTEERLSKRLNGLSAKQKALLALRMKKQNTAQGFDGLKIVPFDRTDQDKFVVSYSQKRFWFLDQWHSNKAANNTHLVTKMVGKLNKIALKQTFDEIFKRHEILQMVYENIDDEIYCRRHPQPVLNISYKTIRAFTKKKREAVIEDYVCTEVHKPFDLAKDLPIRVTLVSASKNEYYLIIVMHHIVSDMWSLRLLNQEIETLYNAFNKGEKPLLKEPPIQYMDYSIWQRKILEGDGVQSQLSYWKDTLKGAPPCLNLITDFPRPDVQTFNGEVYKFYIPSPLAEKIHQITSEETTTPFVFYLTAFAILLYRYSGMNDIVIGSPVAGRTRHEVEDLIGLFINTLALRIDLSDNPSIRRLIRRVKKIVSGAVVNQEMPFEKLLEELQVERNLSHSPVFQVMFNYQSIKKTVSKLDDLEVSPFIRKNNTTKFDLNLSVKLIEEDLVCFLAYNTDLFLPRTIERFAGNYLQTLSEMANQTELAVDGLNILAPKERRILLNEWNHSEYKTHPKLPYIHKLFENQVLKTPHKLAVSSEGKSYTYQELNQEANRLARYLRSLGIGPEKRVGLFIERSLDMIVGLLGVLKAGGAYVPIDPVYPADRIQYILDDASIQIVITQEHLKEKLNQLNQMKHIEAFSLDVDWPQVADFSGENLSIRIEPTNLAYIMYTSGSTGKPKGVLTEHRNYLNYYFGAMKKLNLEPGLKYGIVSTFSSDMATITIWAAWSTGGELHVLTYDQSVDPVEYGGYMRDNRIDVVKIVPSHFKALLEQQANLYDLIPKRMLIFAGEASYWDMIDTIRSVKPETEIQIHCGPTEVTVSALMYTVTEKKPAQHTTTLPLGRPIANVSIYILNGNLQPVPIGAPGELCIGGPGIARGYLDRPELTAEKFISNPFMEESGVESGTRLYRSGDMARFLNNGDIEFLGRADDQIKIRGYRIELGEVYSTLKEYPAVRDAFADIFTDDNGDRKIAAYFVPEDTQSVALSELRSYLVDRLPAIMVPSVFIQVDKIPITINGKVDRKALPPPNLFSGVSENEYEAPRNEIEERIANIWAEVLNIKKVGINDNFFSLGGDSFKALRVVRSIDPTLSVMDLFKYQTIKELAGIVSQERVICDDVLVRISDETDETEEIAMICVPFAGGSPITYRPLAQALSDKYALYAVQVPGHEFTRPDEELKPLEVVAQMCIEEIKEKISTQSIVVYGHCLGATLAVEIARLLEQEGYNLMGVFTGGVFPAAYLPGKLFRLWNKLFPRDRNLSNRAYMDLLRSWGGFEEDLPKEEVDFIIRNLRHDRRESERYYTERYADENHQKLKAPMLCIIGELDRTTEFYEEQYKDWEYFSDRVDVRVIPNAGHYFFKHQAVQVASIINEQLEAWRLDNEEEAKAKALAGSIGETVDKPAIVNKPAAPSLKTFFIFTLGQFVSMMGSNLTNFAMGVWVYTQTGAVMDFATTLIFSRLPGIFALPFAGTLADKKDRRHILIWSNVCSAIVTLFIAAFFYQNMLKPWHIYIALTVRSIVGSFQRPAYLAAVAQIVPKRYLGQANGIVQLSRSAGEVFAPLMGGVLIMVLKLSGIITIDFLSYLCSIIILLWIRFPDTLFRKSEEPFFTQMLGGWNYIRKRHSIVAMILFFVISNLILGTVNVLITPLVLTFGSTAILGMVASASGLGGLTGGILMSIWGGTRNRAVGMVGFNILIGLSYMAMGLKPSIGLVMTANFIYGIALVLVNSHWQTLVQSKVRAELLARVFSINQMFALPTIPLGYYIGGLLSDRIFKPLFVNHPDLLQKFGWLVGTGSERGIGLLFVLFGILMVICGFLGMRYRPLRYMDDILPNAVPGGFFIKDKDAIQEAEDRELEAIKIRLKNIQKKKQLWTSSPGR